MTHGHTISRIFSDKGYDERKLGALATLLHITGYDNNGIIKTPEETPSELTREQISSILSTPTTVEQLNDLFQRNYFNKYRGKGERQQIEDCHELAPHRDRIIGLFKELGYVDSVAPSRTGYDIAFVFGCAEQGLRGRIKELQKLQNGTLLTGTEAGVEGCGGGSGAAAGAAEARVESAITIKDIYILAGERPLWPGDENIAAELFARNVRNAGKPDVTTEVIQADIARIFTENSEKNITLKRKITIDSLTETYGQTWPTEADMANELANEMLPGQSVIVVDAKSRKENFRPDTLDTVQAWKDKYEDKITTLKRVLAISNQPFIPEQMAPLGVLNPAKFEFDIVGKGCEATAKPELLLTAFAGCFYKEMERDKYIAESKTKEMGAGGRTFP